MPIALPPQVERMIRTYFPTRGEQWLADLPELVDKLCGNWGLEVIGDPFGGGTHSFVALVRRGDGSVAVLKVPVVDVENQGEATGLYCYDGDGAVRLYDYDPASGAMLLEWARPGTPLLEQPGAPSLEGRAEHIDRIELACGLYRRLRRAPIDVPAHFPQLPEVATVVADWTTRFGNPELALAQAVPQRLLEHATALCSTLATPDGPPLIVNRDTHLGNIVAAEREPWLLIDPKPYLGEAAFDAGYLALIQVEAEPTPEHATAVVRRTAAALELDPRRVRTWAFLRSMEEVMWSVEDSDPPSHTLYLAIAQALVMS
ncbi:aminoglycoside phosphotransferase family protein [Nocardia sp. CDC159]|uniref:Aminoglycoside phosphotransferase family protein n=1 Tax=Nocardia pulmonis TaxID=2951408 RepID=A0A9X2EA55_9NOCA|nr:MULTISPECIES: aminoglycoside phosphotransferase family protein [Nocardia]MCM6776511.1 aminoglycoside phosphotransferase family protein [Nocardia pulmonis]MCM6788935.1 aminoglycoside phosphotransferase family protein [Nocardia sp. CDC159]